MLPACSDALVKNVKRYPWYLFFRDCHFWGPAFFLYFTSVVSWHQALWLEAVYYVAVALVEVPSGYLADRFGRRPILILSSLCLSMAYLFFFTGNGFSMFVTAQLFLAVGFACSSGTDTALHYESLKGVGRAGEYARREAWALRMSFLAGALSALTGGIIALYQLKLIYMASFLAAVCSALLMWSMKEPKSVSVKPSSLSMGIQVIGVVKKSWKGRFRFFTLYVPILTIVVHLPYEFYQPYLERGSLYKGIGSSAATPAVAGIHLAATMLVGSCFTGFGVLLRRRHWVKSTLICCALVQVLLVGLMALSFSPLIVILLLGRTVSRAVAGPIVNAEITPMLERSERSTYLSLQSLSGRIGYGLVLLALPFWAAWANDAFQGTLVSASIIGVFLVLVLWLTPHYPAPTPYTGRGPDTTCDFD